MLLPPDLETLFVSEVGSAMWGMDTPESDHDYVAVYRENTFNVLTGHTS